MKIFSFLQKRETEPSPQEEPKSTGAAVRAKLVSLGANESALTFSPVLHAINLRARTLARATMEYQRLVKGEWVPFMAGNTDARMINFLLQVKPNRMQNAKQMWEMFYRTCDIYGSAALHLFRDSGGEVLSVWPCRCSHLRESNTYLLSNPMLGGSYEADAGDCIILKSMATHDHPEGRSLLQYAIRTLSLGATAEQFALDTMAKGGTFKGILKQESAMSGLQGLDTIDDAEAKKVASSIQEQWDNGADIATDPSAGNLQQVSQSFQDLQVPMIMDKTTEAVARIFGIPLPLMFTSTNAVYKSVDDAWHSFETLTLKPILEEVEQEFNGKVVNEYNFGKLRFKFNTSGICLDSDKSKAEIEKIYVDAGIKTVNESRAKLGLGPLPRQPETKEGGEA